ncbi:MAG: TrmH family RNA methyltransferase [Planctomycetota bacterium]|nr:TrmH family RNA methyltransferase [Planctomycetota bacterium]
MTDETGGGAADPSLKLERVGCPAPHCGAVFEIPAGRLGRNIYCLECGRRMTARPVGHTERLRAKETEGASGSGAEIERLPLAAVLDDIRSLWNVGSIFRTADGCGVRKLWLAGITGTPPRAEITKTALGAEEQVAWDYRADVLEAIQEARAEGYEPVVVEATEESEGVGEFSWPERPCLVLGNEATGVSPLLLDACERRVSIPMCGVKESFNVAVAFGIAAHQAAMALAAANPGVVFRG